MKHRQNITIEYDIDDKDNPPDIGDIEFALGGDIKHLHTQKRVDGKWKYDDRGNLKS